MSKEKQFEHIENKIREAAQKNDPAFNEEAWSKMEVLLDKEKKKRRPILWLWVLPILIGAAFLISKNTGNKQQENTQKLNSVSVEKKRLSENEKTADENSTVIAGKKENSNLEETIPEKLQSTNDLNENSLSQDREQASSRSKVAKQRSPSTVFNDLNIPVKNKRQQKNTVGVTTSKDEGEIYKPNKETKNDGENSAGIENKISEAGKVSTIITSALPEDITTESTAKTSATKADSTSKNINSTKEKQKEKAIAQARSKNKKASANKFLSNLYFIGSAGIDAGSVKLFSFGTTTAKPKYGLGIGYSISKKISLQTGFYISDKKYSGGPGYYHVKPGSYWDMPYVKLQKVSASCVVYDIPLSLRFDLASKKSISYYALAGLSSYLMKKEDYNYYYTKYGTPAERFYSYSGNKHFISNMNLGAGIEKKISNIISIQLEPSLSIPLSGVGDGKVKLYSTAVLLGIKYYPFKK